MIYEVKTRVIHDTSGLFSLGDITNRPSPTITASGAGQIIVKYYYIDSPP